MSGLCEHCVNPGDKQTGTPVGRLGEYAGVEAYITGDDKKNVIIYATDVFGVGFLNNRLLADAFAAGGFTVIMPRTIQEDIKPAPVEAYLHTIPEWLTRNSVAHANSVITRVVAQARTEFETIQGVGFCYGARMIVDVLAGSSFVLYHPTLLTPEDAPTLRAANVPVLFNCAETDTIFTDELKATFQSELASVAGARFETYAGTVHGFGGRPEGEVAQAESARARAVAIDFFKAQRV